MSVGFDRDLKNWKDQIYECVRCGIQFKGEAIAIRGQIKCPQCSYKIIKKVRPPIVKRVKAV